MIIISNKNIPEQALEQLKDYGKVLTFETSGLTYPAISCHPDVFLCLANDQIIIAPNTPGTFRKLLTENNVRFSIGHSEVGSNYPETAKYNSVITKHYLIHNLEITDNSIKEACVNKIKINVNQGYTRCNLLPLEDENFITSDKGIYNKLHANKLNVFYVDPKGILLSGFKNGFFGGVCGVHQNLIFTIGSLSKLTGSKQVVSFLKDAGCQIIELYDGLLIDCGSLIFID